MQTSDLRVTVRLQPGLFERIEALAAKFDVKFYEILKFAIVIGVAHMEAKGFGMMTNVSDTT